MTAILRRSSSALGPVDGSTLFDRQPARLPGFEFRSRSVKVIGKPGEKDFEAALALAGAMEQGAPYFIADLMAYADTRAEWHERKSQLLSATGLAPQRLLGA